MENPITILDIIAIVLGLVALIVTVIGFFASLKFYRDGSEMQGRARDALAKIEEKAANIQSQVGGMFDKTLDAALGRSSPFQAERQQRLPQEVPPPSVPSSMEPPTAGAETASKPPAGLASADTEPTRSVLRDFIFRQMRMTDVSDATARAVFALGAAGGFNLFDGTPGIIFFGFFQSLEPVEIVARARSLFGNIETTYRRIRDNPDFPQREEALRILDQISVEVLTPEDMDNRRLAAKIDEYQPAARRISVVLHKPSELISRVAAEYEKMKI